MENWTNLNKFLTIERAVLEQKNKWSKELIELSSKGEKEEIKRKRRAVTTCPSFIKKISLSVIFRFGCFLFLFGDFSAQPAFRRFLSFGNFFLRYYSFFTFPHF